MLDLKGLWMCDASNTFKLEHTRTDKGSKKAWLSFIQRELGMSMNLVILGRPPGRALFNVKSRTLRALTMVFCWWRQCCYHGNSSLFFIFLGQDARTYTNLRQDMNWERNLLWGTHIPPPHLEFAKLQVYGVQVSFCSCSFIKAYQGCSSHVCRCCLSVILLDLPLKRLATKNTRRKTIF